MNLKGKYWKKGGLWKSKWPVFSFYTANVYRGLQGLCGEIRVRGFQIYGDCMYTKGQLISECLFEKIVWTKIPTKNLIDSAQQRLLPQG